MGTNLPEWGKVYQHCFFKYTRAGITEGVAVFFWEYMSEQRNHNTNGASYPLFVDYCFCIMQHLNVFVQSTLVKTLAIAGD